MHSIFHHHTSYVATVSDNTAVIFYCVFCICLALCLSLFNQHSCCKMQFTPLMLFHFVNAEVATFSSQYTASSPVSCRDCRPSLIDWLIIDPVIFCIDNYLCQGRYVMPGICPFVCLLATLHKNYWTYLRESFTTDISVDKEELIKLWKSSASGSGSRIPQRGSYIWKNWSDLHKNFTTNVSSGKEDPAKLWKSSGFGVCLGGGMHIPSSPRHHRQSFKFRTALISQVHQTCALNLWVGQMSGTVYHQFSSDKQ